MELAQAPLRLASRRARRRNQRHGFPTEGRDVLAPAGPRERGQGQGDARGQGGRVQPGCPRLLHHPHRRPRRIGRAGNRGHASAAPLSGEGIDHDRAADRGRGRIRPEDQPVSPSRDGRGFQAQLHACGGPGGHGGAVQDADAGQHFRAGDVDTHPRLVLQGALSREEGQLGVDDRGGA